MLTGVQVEKLEDVRNNPLYLGIRIHLVLNMSMDETGKIFLSVASGVMMRP